MSERNRTAVHVCTRSIETEFFFHSEVLRRERFIHLYEIDITERQTCPLERRASGGYWSDTHDFRFDTGIGPAHDPAHRFQIPLLNKFLTCYNKRRCAIDNARRISRCDESILRKRGFEFRETF